MDQWHLAPAKVNLTLHVTGRRSDGYHRLDSLVAFADVGDRIRIEPGDGLTVAGPFADGVPTDASNLIRRALDMAGTRRAVALEKNLPHPAGIGGGSADAAAVLRAVKAALSVGQLLSLGADLPVCMAGASARMRGVGERLEPIALPLLHGVLINPGVAVPTAQVFQDLETPDNEGHSTPLPTWETASDLIHWLGRQRNDLERPARRIAPVIDDVLSALRDAGASLARMSGSGATCFGLWSDRAAAEAAADRVRRPGWWVQACTLS